MAILEQPYFVFDHGRWISRTSEITTSFTVTIPSEKVGVKEESENEKEKNKGNENGRGNFKIRVITWNIDCFMPSQSLRMCSAMEYLGELLDSADASIPTVIFLQETTGNDLSIIEKMNWVQRGYFMTDLNNQYLHSTSYGSTALIDKSLTIERVFRVPMRSRMGRDGLFVDLLRPSAAADTTTNNPLRIRLCSVHLESLIANPPLRPEQIALVASYLHSKHVHGGVVAGDFNAIQDFDRNFHTDYNLVDVYLALGGEENSDKGCTWGFQSPSEQSKRYPPCRMDKILCTGDFQPLRLRRIGIGAKVLEEKCENKQEIESQPYLSDHYGLMGEVSLKSS